MLDQTIWKLINISDSSQRKLNYFFQYGKAQSSVSIVTNGVATGFNWTGVSSKKPNDILALGFAYGGFTRNKDAGYKKPAEMNIEMFYYTSPYSWLTIQPDVQYVIHPGGKGLPNALVLILQVGIQI